MHWEYASRIPMVDNYDVIIVGGGIAGVSSALAAVRQGSRVLLVEKHCNVGGLATLGLISWYLPVCDGKGNLVSTGIPQELLEIAKTCTTAITRKTYPAGDRMQTWFIPEEFAILLERLLIDQKCSILYDTTFIDVVCEGTRCIGVVLATKEGLSLYTANAIVDATGEASVLHRAKVATESRTNPFSCWYQTTSKSGSIEMRMLGADAHGAFDHKRAGSGGYTGDNSQEVSNYMMSCRDAILKDADIGNPDKDVMVVAIPKIPQLRCVRRLIGYEKINESDCNRFVASSVGCVADWRTAGRVYELPFLSLFGKGIANIVAAGRCVSADDAAYEVLRCIPQSAATGQAAGTIAALYSQHLCLSSMAEMDIEVVQHALEDQGVRLHV